MLRASFGGTKDAILEEEVEVGDKPSKLIHSNVRQGSGGDGKVGEKEKGPSTSVGGSGVIKGKEDGPMFEDLFGMDDVLEELKMRVILPFYNPHVLHWLGVKPMAGILLHGPPGCGKTKLAHAIANEAGVPFYKISGTEVVSGVPGATEEIIRDLFSKAYRTAPSIVFIDEIDAIASKRDSLQSQMERRIVSQLMIYMDESNGFLVPTDGESKSESSERRPGYVLVIGATNRLHAIDPALRRSGRFDREIVLGVPDPAARLQILYVLTRNMRVEGSFDRAKIARSTPGFVGGDLAALANKAGNLAMKRIIDRKKTEVLSEPVPELQTEEWWKQPWMPEEMERVYITMADFEEAAKLVQPSKWEDVGWLDSLRHEFDR